MSGLTCVWVPCATLGDGWVQGALCWGAASSAGVGGGSWTGLPQPHLAAELGLGLGLVASKEPQGLVRHVGAAQVS